HGGGPSRLGQRRLFQRYADVRRLLVWGGQLEQSSRREESPVRASRTSCCASLLEHLGGMHAIGGLLKYQRPDVDLVRHVFASSIARRNSTPGQNVAWRSTPHDPWREPHVTDHAPTRRESAHPDASGNE